MAISKYGDKVDPVIKIGFDSIPKSADGHILGGVVGDGGGYLVFSMPGCVCQK